MLPVKNAIRNFVNDEGGSLLAELVIVLPVLVWSYFALFVYWDAFRSMNTVQKAAYTISDTISREMKTFSPTYVDGLRNVMDYMLDDDQDVKLRLTSITFDEDEDKYIVMWSYSPGNDMPKMTNGMLDDLEFRIPDMADSDYATILETEVPYVPIFNVGMGDQNLTQFIVTRPRFVSPNCLTGEICTYEGS